MPPVAHRLQLFLAHAVPGEEFVGGLLLRYSRTGDRQSVGHQFVDARIVARKVAKRCNVAGLADEREALSAREQGGDVHEGRGRAVARGGAVLHLARAEAELALGLHRRFPRRTDVQDEIDLAVVEQEHPERGEGAARRGAELDLVVRRPAPPYAHPGTEHRVLERGALCRAAIDDHPRAHVENPFHDLGPKAGLLPRAQEAGRDETHLDRVAPGHGLAQPAADAQPGTADGFEVAGAPDHLPSCSLREDLSRL